MAKSVVYNQKRTTACSGPPPIFRSNDDALLWAVRQGAFADGEEAQRRANPAPKQGRLLRG